MNVSNLPAYLNVPSNAFYVYLVWNFCAEARSAKFAFMPMLEQSVPYFSKLCIVPHRLIPVTVF